MKRTSEIITLNNELKIVRLKGVTRFKHPLGYTAPWGYCLKHPEKGYFAFAGNTEPYIPCGGRKALVSILEQGGFLDFDNIIWLQPFTQA